MLKAIGSILLLCAGILSAHAQPSTGQVVGGVYSATPPTYADRQTTVFQTDANGNLKVNVTAGGAAATTNAPVAPAAATATNSTLIGAQYNVTRPTFADGQQGALQVGTRGSLNVSIVAPDSATSVLVQGTGSDGTSNTINGLAVSGFNFVLNAGTTWDRQRSITNATNSTGTGIVASGLVGQLDDTSPTAITENQFGNLRIAPSRALVTTIDARMNTFSVGLNNNTPAANTTDFWQIQGSGTRTIRIFKIKMYGTATAYATMRGFLYVATSCATGGTSTNATAARLDTASIGAQTATLLIYSANPTIASGLQSVAQPLLTFANATAGPLIPFEWRAEEYGGPIVLRGTSQCLVFNLGGNAVPAGGLIHIENLQWTEE